MANKPSHSRYEHKAPEIREYTGPYDASIQEIQESFREMKIQQGDCNRPDAIFPRDNPFHNPRNLIKKIQTQ